MTGTACCRALYAETRSLDFKVLKVFVQGVASSELFFLKITLPYREESMGASRNRLASGYAVVQVGDNGYISEVQWEWKGVDISEIFSGGRNRRTW